MIVRVVRHILCLRFLNIKGVLLLSINLTLQIVIGVRVGIFLLINSCQSQKASLLLEVVNVERVDRLEVVGDEEEKDGPFEFSRGIHAENHHKDELKEERWL